MTDPKGTGSEDQPEARSLPTTERATEKHTSTASSMPEVALDWAARGVPVFPVAISWDEDKQATNKRPLLSNGHLGASLDPDTVRGWFESPRLRDGEELGVGLHPGPAGFIVLDPDRHGGAEGPEYADRIGAVGGWTADTASGGEHRWFRKPPGRSYSNSIPKAWKGLIDVRADGGWVVAPGTVTSWGPWTARAPWDPSSIPVLPDCIDALLTAPQNGSTGTGWQRYKPATHDALLHPATVEALGILLRDYGVTLDRVTFRARGDEPYLDITRPGKQGGNSATLGYVGPGVLKVFSTGWDDFPEGVYDLLVEDEQQGEEWPDPKPLEKLPDPIPLDGLPEMIRRLIEDVAKKAEAPIEVSFSAVFGTLSAATRGVFEVAPHASWNAGPTTLWPVTLAPSGERKDGAMDPIVQALKDAEKDLAPTVSASIYRARAEVARHMKQAKEHEKHGRWDQVADETRLADEAAPREQLDLILDDTTTEALGVHMMGQRGVAAIFSTEAQAFRTVAGAYSDSGANVSLLNKSYDGKEYRDRRVKRLPINLPRTALTWCAAVQPEVLAGYANGDTEGSGFIARFLLLAPRTLVGYRTGNVHTIDPLVMADWVTRVRAIHGKAWGIFEKMTPRAGVVGTPIILPLDEGGRDLILDMGRNLEARKRPGGDLVGLGGWIEKHPARIARIAALLALWENPDATIVARSHVEAAASLSESLIEHGRWGLHIMRGSKGRSEERALRDALPKVKREQDGTVTTRNVHQAVRDQAWTGGEVEPVRAALGRLDLLGWVRRIEVRGQKGGRPSERWALHPALTGAQGSEGFEGVGGKKAKGVLDTPPLTNPISAPSDGHPQNPQNPAPPLADPKPAQAPAPRFRARTWHVPLDEAAMLAPDEDWA